MEIIIVIIAGIIALYKVNQVEDLKIKLVVKEAENVALKK